MLSLKGTHGTSQSNAEKICDVGFQLGKGRRGTGAYFWRYGYFSKQLARSWWEQCYNEGRYKRNNNQKCAIIITEFNIDESEYCNIESFEIKDKISELAVQKNVGSSIKKLAALYDLFIKKLEEQQNTKFKIIEMRVSPPNPKYCQYYPIVAIGDPYCFLLRQFDCIAKITVIID